MSQSEQEKRGPGRPQEYTGERKPVTTLWPIEILKYIDSVADNRTKWLIEAAQEKIEREQTK